MERSQSQLKWRGSFGTSLLNSLSRFERGKAFVVNLNFMQRVSAGSRSDGAMVITAKAFEKRRPLRFI
jgi:hypothetical protein